MILRLGESCSVSLYITARSLRWRLPLHGAQRSPTITSFIYHTSPRGQLYQPIRSHSASSLQPTITYKKTFEPLGSIPHDTPDNALQIFKTQLSTCQAAESTSFPSIAALWNAYTDLSQLNTNGMTADLYEDLAEALYRCASSTRRSKYWPCLTRIFEDAKGHSQTTPRLSEIAIVAYGRTGGLDEATTIYKGLDTHNDIRHSLFLQACLHHGSLIQAEETLRKISDKPTHSQYLQRLVDVSFKKTNPRMAIETAGKYEADKQDLATTKLLFQGYGRSFSVSVDVNHPESMEAFFSAFYDRMRGNADVPSHKLDLYSVQHLHTLVRYLVQSTTPELSTQTCGLLLDICASHQHFKCMQLVLGYMLNHDISLTSWTTSALVKAFAPALCLQDTRTLYAHWKHSGQLDTRICNAFIQVFGRQISMEDVQQVEKDMHSLELPIDADAQRLIVEGYRDAHQIDHALTWLQQFNGHEEYTHLDMYATVMNTWLDHGRFEDCIEQYNKMRTGALADHVAKHNNMTQAAVTALCAEGRWSACQRLLSDRRSVLPPTATTDIVNTLLDLKRNDSSGYGAVRGSRIVRSIKTLEEVLQVHLNSSAVVSVIDHLGDRGELRDIYRLLHWLEKCDVNSSRTRTASRRVYWAVMKAAIHCQDLRGAEKAWDKLVRCTLKATNLPHSPLDTVTFNKLLSVYAERSPEPRLRQVKEAFELMLAEAQQPDTVTYNIIIKTFVRLNRTDAALRVLDIMLGSNIQPDIWTMNTLMQGWIVKKDWTGLATFIQTIKERQLPMTFDMVTFYQLIQGVLFLDTNDASHLHMLKRRHCWPEARKFEAKLPPYPLHSDTIWDILDLTLGCRREHFETNVVEDVSTANPIHTLVGLFAPDKQQAIAKDENTIKLFCRAFRRAGDARSANKLWAWSLATRSASAL